MTFSTDVFEEPGATTWTAVVYRHAANGGDGDEVWRKTGMRTEWNALQAMDAAYQHCLKAAGHAPGPPR